jgi:hypothetical protein
MTEKNLSALTVAELVETYAAIGIEEDKAEMDDDLPTRNRLCSEMFAIGKELKGRPGDQRRALLVLYDHPNVEVRLMAAKSTLAIAPVEARKVIQSIADSKRYPYAGDAGMCLWDLDRGVFVPE